MKYRPEIDGLRAVAVIPVILFHAGVENFGGGYVGVDVFFVISGYLITTIILSEMNGGEFSIASFYERRARRILPPLYFVMLISLFFAWAWLIPSDMKRFSQSLVAVSTFSSNIFFWRQTGYWTPSLEFEPLLHTWSLAVEEQYYVIFPLFLLLMMRFRNWWLLVTLIFIVIVSLVLAEWGAYNYPVANFFMLPTRGWELAIGAIIAFLSFCKPALMAKLTANKIFNEIFGIIGLSMIGYAVYAFMAAPFPGIYALVPTLGTGLIIMFSSPATIVGRFLSLKFLVGIGLISYSAYLWHQPILAFAHHKSLTEPSDFLVFLLVFVTFPIAYLSWRYVEKPFRNRERTSRRQIVQFSAAGSLLFISVGMAGHVTDGFGVRYGSNLLALQKIVEKTESNFGLSEACNGNLTFSDECRTDDEPEVAVWGDSFAMHIVKGIIESNPDVKLIQFTKSLCAPFSGVAHVGVPLSPLSLSRECLEYNNMVLEWLRASKSVKYLAISSTFFPFLTDGETLLSRNGELLDVSLPLVVKEFEETLDEITAMGIHLAVFSPPPSDFNNRGRCLVRASLEALDLDACNYLVADIQPIYFRVYDFLEKFREDYRVVRLDEFICDDTVCRAHLGSAFLYNDNLHLSNEGSARLGKKYDFYDLIVRDYSGGNSL